MKSWRGGTKKQYAVYIRKWTEFCSKRETDHSYPFVVDVLDFLSDLLDAGLTYSAVNTARSALAAFVTLEDGTSVGNNALISRLLRGIFQSRPPKPKYDAVWDVQIVLNHLKTLYPVESLKLKELTLKLLMLLLLVTGQRRQTIHLMDIKNMTTHANTYVFTFPDHLKQSKPGNPNPKLYLQPHEDQHICVVNTLKEYLRRTGELRKDQYQ